MCKKIQKSGCNVLLIQKSILRDAVNELSLHFLAKMKILVVKDIEREDVEFISKTVGCMPIANVETVHAEKLGRADLVEEVPTGDGRVVKVTGVPGTGKTVTLLCKASNRLVLDESERSLHDALCVLRCLVKKRFLTPGGGAPEMQCSYQLAKWANSLEGMQQYCVRAFAEAMEVVPYTLAENAGLDAIQVVTELRNRHAKGEAAAGINVGKGRGTSTARLSRRRAARSSGERRREAHPTRGCGGSSAAERNTPRDESREDARRRRGEVEEERGEAEGEIYCTRERRSRVRRPRARPQRCGLASRARAVGALSSRPPLLSEVFGHAVGRLPCVVGT